MQLDPQGLEAARRMLDALLAAEAEDQRAYLFHFPDGRVSLELEWIDMHSILSAAIAAYVGHANSTAAPKRRFRRTTKQPLGE